MIVPGFWKPKRRTWSLQTGIRFSPNVKSQIPSKTLKVWTQTDGNGMKIHPNWSHIIALTCLLGLFRVCCFQCLNLSYHFLSLITFPHLQHLHVWLTHGGHSGFTLGTAFDENHLHLHAHQVGKFRLTRNHRNWWQLLSKLRSIRDKAARHVYNIIEPYLASLHLTLKRYKEPQASLPSLFILLPVSPGQHKSRHLFSYDPRATPQPHLKEVLRKCTRCTVGRILGQRQGIDDLGVRWKHGNWIDETDFSLMTECKRCNLLS